MTATDARATGSEPPQARLDRPVLVGGMVSGALWLLPVAFASWPLAVVGAAYVAAASAFLAAAYARTSLTRRQEALAWAAPWLAAVALWGWLLAGIDGGHTGSAWWLLLGLVIATPAYLAWQLSALAVRQLMAWRSTPAARQG